MRVGDPHVRPGNLEEAEKLFHFINDKILELQPNRVEILGDLMHSHAVIRLEVLNFWNEWLDVLVAHENVEFVILIGNHDMSGNYESHSSALSVFQHIAKKHKNLKIVERPRVDGIYGYVSYTHDKEQFITIAKDLALEGAKVLVCHQSFLTSKFESGTYDPDGIDPDPIPFNLIISGHIHAHQECTFNGKTILHPGTPMWHSNSDANENKGIWMYEHDNLTGKILKSHFFSTAKVVTPIFSLIWREGESMPETPSVGKITIELVGSSQWVSDQKKLLKGQYGIKTKITDRIDKIARKPGQNFRDFVTNIYPTGVDRTKLLEYMKENGIV